MGDLLGVWLYVEQPDSRQELVTFSGAYKSAAAYGSLDTLLAASNLLNVNAEENTVSTNSNAQALKLGYSQMLCCCSGKLLLCSGFHTFSANAD